MIRFAQPQPVSLEEALHWSNSAEWLYEEKKDGCRAMLMGDVLQGRNRPLPLPGPVPPGLAHHVLDGELCGSVYWVFDTISGELSKAPLWKRRLALGELCLPPWVKMVPSTRGNGGEFLEAVLALGGNKNAS